MEGSHDSAVLGAPPRPGNGEPAVGIGKAKADSDLGAVRWIMGELRRLVYGRMRDRQQQHLLILTTSFRPLASYINLLNLEIVVQSCVCSNNFNPNLNKMAREGTRSATGNSKPRVFETVDTQPAIKRTTKPKATTTKDTTATKVKGAKPAGVTKKTPAKKEGAGAKAKAAVSKVTAKAKGEETKAKKAAKPKTTTTTK
ncbi:hypothetical protein AB5N19_02701 [Seiridium cardinale]